ncbi:MAG: hypothetical protein J7K40_14340 [candidate division Zixibacteria bacterium]|nr:hypothetical protein [candidate division Zixibacteria bacterium]
MPVDFPPTKLTLDYLVIRDGEGHYLQVPKLTTTERDALSPTNGILIYNTTTAQFERYADDTWEGFGSDLTGAEIKALYEAEADTNAYTDAEKSKLAGIESNATADQTGAEIKSLYEAEADTNAFTDAHKLILDGYAPTISTPVAQTIGSAQLKYKEIKVKIAGKYKIRVEHHSTHPDGKTYLQFKKNGVNISEINSFYGTTWRAFEKEVDNIAVDDLIQVYMSQANAPAQCRNFSVSIICGEVTQDTYYS